MKQRQCQYTKDDLTKCTSFAMNGSDYCYRHNPDIPENEKHIASSKGGSHSPSLMQLERGLGGEEPLPEMKMENLRDVANSLADSINQVRAGKISPKTGGTLAYMSFVLYMIMDKAKEEEKKDEKEKLIAEGKYRPHPTYGGKHYFYKDEFYLDKNGNELIVEKDSSTFYPEKKFKREKPDKSEKLNKNRQVISILNPPCPPLVKGGCPQDGGFNENKKPSKSNHRNSKHKHTSSVSSDEEYAQKTIHLLNTLKEGMDMRKADDLKKEKELNSS